LSSCRSTTVYHVDYPQSDAVRQAGFPTWQPLVWLAQSVVWHPGVFIFSLDFFISVLAVLGVRRLWSRSRAVALWLIVAQVFLLLWTTKWPQYTLALTFPLALAAAEGFWATLWEPLIDGLRRLRRNRALPAQRAESRIGWRETRRALPWLMPGLAVLFLIVLYPLIFQSAMSLTDFSGAAIRDGITGGVWRAVGEGLTGQAEPVEYNPFNFNPSQAPKTVSYAGHDLLAAMFSGGLASVVVFEVTSSKASAAGSSRSRRPSTCSRSPC
jgi:hypothetical protein